MKPCSFPECPRGYYASGWCQYHYLQKRRDGELRPAPPVYAKDRPLIDRFSVKVDKKGPTMPGMSTRCWTWIGAKSVSGYGQMHNPDNGKLVRATHVSLLLFKSLPIKPGQCALHSCDNQACVRPSHLRYGTRSENAKDALLRGRMARGEKSGKAVLTDEAVRKMRKLASKGQTHHQLAALFQTSASNVGQVLSRQTWKHVK